MDEEIVFLCFKLKNMISPFMIIVFSSYYSEANVFTVLQ